MDLSQILGWIATFLFTIMFIPQVLTTLKNRCVKNVSLSMFVLGFIANIIALIYSIMIDQPPLQIKYLISLIVIGIYLVIYFKIGNKK